jgi:hypothetical protein
MQVIITVENRNGMLFSHRRVSRDQKVSERILAYCKEKKLWMNAYSAKLFENNPQICVSETFLEQKDAICFVEDQDVTPYLPEIDTIILFHWNRDYPADLFFTVDLSEWNRIHQEEFAGKSHDKITMEVYKK